MDTDTTVSRKANRNAEAETRSSAFRYTLMQHVWPREQVLVLPRGNSWRRAA